MLTWKCIIRTENPNHSAKDMMLFAVKITTKPSCNLPGEEEVDNEMVEHPEEWISNEHHQE
jgi:hypothetical protein